MVEDYAGEVAVDAVVEVQHVGRQSGRWILDVAAGNDIAGQCEGGGDVIAAWFADNADAGGEILVEGFAEHRCHFFESVAGEATAYVEGFEVVADFGGLIKDEAGVLDSFGEALWVGSS